MSTASRFAQLKERYNLQEFGLNQQISDRHIQEFSHGRMWKHMPNHLGLSRIVAEGIDHAPKSEEEKQYPVFSKWKQRMGSSATYKALIIALLAVDRVEDAESVCKRPSGSFKG